MSFWQTILGLLAVFYSGVAVVGKMSLLDDLGLSGLQPEEIAGIRQGVMPGLGQGQSDYTGMANVWDCRAGIGGYQPSNFVIPEIPKPSETAAGVVPYSESRYTSPAFRKARRAPR